MNKIYSKVWNNALRQVVVASEFARQRNAVCASGAPMPRARALSRALAVALVFGAGIAPWMSAQAQAYVGYEYNGLDYCTKGGSATFSSVCSLWGSSFRTFTGSDVAYLSGMNGTTQGGAWAGNNNAGVWYGNGPDNPGGSGSRVWVYQDNASVQGATVNLLSTNGVNVADQQIHSLAAGTTPTDAVNVAQLDAQETHYFSVNDDGTQGGNFANDGASGVNSVAIGVGASTATTATGAVAIGNLAQALGGESVSIGGGNSANGDGVVSIGGGNTNTATGTGTLAIGNGNTVGMTAGAKNTGTTTGAVALGSGNTAGDAYQGVKGIVTKFLAAGDGAVAIGESNTATGPGAVALGYGSSATLGATFPSIEANEGPIAIGFQASATGGSIVLGTDASAQQQGIALGYQSVGKTSGVAMGHNTDSELDSVALGSNAVGLWGSVAVGLGAQADAKTFQIDPTHTAFSSGSIAIGRNASANMTSVTDVGQGMIAIGDGAEVGHGDSIAMGRSAAVNAAGGVALGSTAVVSGIDGLAFGLGAQASGANAISVGAGNVVSGDNSGAFGDPSTVTGTGSYSFGNNNTVSGNNAFVLGSNITDTVDNSVALGANSTVAAANTAYYNPGSDALAGTASGVVSVGAAVAERQIQNVAPGSNPTDAVNVSQLSSLGTSVANLGNSVASGMGGKSSYEPTTGAVTTSLNVGGNTYNNVNDAITAVNTTATAGWNVTTATTGSGVANGTSMANVAPGGTATFTAGNNIIETQTGTTVAFGVNPVMSGITSLAITGGPTLSAGGIDMGNTTISNLAQGKAGSDAVTLDQLNAATAGSQIHYFSVNDGGTQGGNFANDGASGVNSVAIGVGASTATTAAGAVAIGNLAQALGGESVSIGGGNSANGDGAIAIGGGSANLAAGTGALALGNGNSAIKSTLNTTANPEVGIVALGSGNTAGDATFGILPGNPTKFLAAGIGAVAIGENNVAGGPGAVALGFGSKATVTNIIGTIDATRYGSVAIGYQANASDAAVALGSGARAGVGGFAVGTNANGNQGSIALGAGAAGITNSVSIGQNTTGNINSVAIGTGAVADKAQIGVQRSAGSIVIGENASANIVSAADTNGRMIAIGSGAEASHSWTVALGGNTKGDALYGVAVGFGAAVTGNNGAAVGANSVASGDSALAFGNGAQATAQNAIAIGTGNKVSGSNSGAFGDPSTVTGTGSYSFGNNNTVSGNNAFVLGSNVTDAIDNSVALGANSTVAAANTAYYNPGSDALAGTASGVVSVGAAGAERQIQNVAPGSNPTDAVNVSQLSSLGTSVTNLGNSVASGLGGSSTYDPTTGTVTTSLNYDGNTYNSVQGVFDQISGSVDGGGIKYFHANSKLADSQAIGVDSVAIGPNAVASVDSSVALGAGAVTTAAVNTAGATINGSNYTYAGAAPVGVVSVGSVGAERQIQNVAAGQVSATSTDAVNGSQLFATNEAVDALGTTVDNINNGNGIKYFHANSTDPDSVAGGLNSVAIGPNAVASTDESVALGDGAITAAAVASTGASIGGVNYTFAGGAPVGVVSVGSAGNERQITNVAAGQLSSTSTDAVNGSQLYATNQQVTKNSNDITTLQNTVNTINSGGGGMFQASTDSKGSPTATGTNAAAGGANAVASGNNSTAVGNDSTASGTGSTAVGNGASAIGTNSVAIGAGSVADRDDSVSVGSAGDERQITNVAAGTSGTDAVNVNQLKASQAGGVHYDNNSDGTTNYTSVTMNPGGDPTVIHNVGAGTANNDVANVGQVNNAIQTAQDWSKDYTDQRFNTLNSQLNTIGNRANAGIASTIAMTNLAQPYEPNMSGIGVALGTFHGETGMAVGLSTVSENGRWVLKANASTDSRGDAGAGVGATWMW